MKTCEKIRAEREKLGWSQEQMAERLNLTANGYAKIERGETKLYLDRLEQIANIFNINITELLPNNIGLNFTVNAIGSNNNSVHLHNSNNYGDSVFLVQEVEKLQAIIEQKDLLLAEKDQRIQSLIEINQFLKDQNNKSQP